MFCHRAIPITLLAFCVLLRASGTLAAEQGAEVAAEKLVGATVTLRIATPADANKPAERKDGDAKTDEPKSAKKAESPDEVTVCSAIGLGNGRLVTVSTHGAAARYRVTLPGGEQAEAEPRVVDNYSGLMLLEITGHELPGLKLAERLPKVGSAIVTAAAAGLEGPAVSRGILGGVERTLSGVELPPLLECDVRTTSTSSGAAVVDAAGQLIGIVAATGASREGTGWTYALPVEHVRRLLAAWQDKKIVELKRRRPVAGFKLGPGAGEGTVLVERVEPGGPADKAGIRAGDLVVEAEGRKIRSAYQAVNLILKKQPGDRFELVVHQEGKPRTTELTLDGGKELVAASDSNVKVGPQLTARPDGKGGIEVRGSGGVAEVAVNPDAPRVRRSPGDELEMLRVQVFAFEKVIRKLQDELGRRATAQAETEKLLEELRAEVARLRSQMEK